MRPPKSPKRPKKGIKKNCIQYARFGTIKIKPKVSTQVPLVNQAEESKIQEDGPVAEAKPRPEEQEKHENAASAQLDDTEESNIQEGLGNPPVDDAD